MQVTDPDSVEGIVHLARTHMAPVDADTMPRAVRFGGIHYYGVDVNALPVDPAEQAAGTFAVFRPFDRAELSSPILREDDRDRRRKKTALVFAVRVTSQRRRTQ